MFAPFLIAGVRHRRFAHRENSQHRQNFCSDIRKVRWNWCRYVTRARPTDCCNLEYLGL
jgi:hypothetical protein